MSLHSLSWLLAHLQRRNSVPTISSICHNLPGRRLASSIPPGPLNDRDTSSHPPAVDAQQLSHLKRPSRAGQDLSRRYQRLERSLRGKTNYGRDIQHLSRTGEVADPAPYTSEEDTQEATTTLGNSTRRIFKGFVVPEAPKPPADDECCMSGCAVCVYDLYDEARKDYIQAVDNLRAELTKLGVADTEWPADIRPDWQGGQTSPVSKPNVTFSAFEQLEATLKAKRAKDAQTTSPSSARSSPEKSEITAAPVVRKRPPKKGVGMNDVYEGVRWVLFSNR